MQGPTLSDAQSVDLSTVATPAAPGRVTLPGVDPTARERLSMLQTADARHRAGRIFLILRGCMIAHPAPKDPAAHAKRVARRRAANKVARASRQANR